MINLSLTKTVFDKNGKKRILYLVDPTYGGWYDYKENK